MSAKTYKRLPYGTSNFERLIVENYAYVDKTQFIEMLEKESNPNQFFIRPRKFGKSLFLSMLSYYYDMLRVNCFQELFGGLYIGKNPTPLKNSYAVMEFDFSGLDTSSPENFIKSFNWKVQMLVQRFLKKYESVFEQSDTLIGNIERNQSGIGSLEVAYSAAIAANAAPKAVRMAPIPSCVRLICSISSLVCKKTEAYFSRKIQAVRCTFCSNDFLKSSGVLVSSPEKSNSMTA